MVHRSSVVNPSGTRVTSGAMPKSCDPFRSKLGQDLQLHRHSVSDGSTTMHGVSSNLYMLLKRNVLEAAQLDSALINPLWLNLVFLYFFVLSSNLWPQQMSQYLMFLTLSKVSLKSWERNTTKSKYKAVIFPEICSDISSPVLRTASRYQKYSPILHPND